MTKEITAAHKKPTMEAFENTICTIIKEKNGLVGSSYEEDRRNKPSRKILGHKTIVKEADLDKFFGC